MKKNLQGIFLLFTFLFNQSFSNPVDSLKARLDETLEDSIRIKILLKISDFKLNQNPGEALVFARKALALSKQNKNLLHKCYSNIGQAYEAVGKYSEAITNYFRIVKVLEDASVRERENFLSQAYDLIGGIYLLQKNFDKAISYRKQAIELAQKINDHRGVAVINLNLGNVYYYKEDLTNAISCYESAANIFKELYDDQSYATATNNIGAIYFEQENFKSSLRHFLESYQTRLKINDAEEVATCLNNIGEVYGKLGEIDSAIVYFKNALSLSEKANLRGILEVAYQNLAGAYEVSNDFKNALYYHRLYSSTKDSIFNEESSRQFHEMSVKYETDKKEKENQLLNQTIKIKEVESSRQQLVILLIGTILLVLGFVAFVLVKQNRLKNRINYQLAEKNKIIEDQHKNITDSIHYSRRIQDAILPPMQLWHELLPQSFIIYKPKDIVSGDFYWMEKVKDTVFFAAADCTGHGVPGAMVSVVCSTALNRTVKEFGIAEPGQILDKVRELVLETFEKSESDVKDGMDISLVALHRSSDSEQYTVKWSGANNPLWYLQNGEPKEITGNKQPVGKVDNPQPFTTHSVQLSKGDSIYIFTDGYADQFGGLKGKKLKYKNFRDTILSNISFDIKTQKRNIEQSFNRWKGHYEQVDDVCVIGVRL